MKMIKVQFLGGESRYKAGCAANCMISSTGIEEYNLYAERIVTTENEMEGYEELKEDIIRQANNLGFHESTLTFN